MSALGFLSTGPGQRRTITELEQWGLVDGVEALVDRGLARWVVTRSGRRASVFLTIDGQVRVAS